MPTQSDRLPLQKIAGSPCGTIVCLWMLRLLVPLGGYKYLVRERDFRDDDIAIAVGLNDLVTADKSATRFDQQTAIARLREVWLAAEQKSAPPPDDESLDRRVLRLGEALGLNTTEIAVLRFLLEACRTRELGELLDMMGAQSLVSLTRILSGTLALPESDVAQALKSDSGLVASGIVELRTVQGFSFLAAISLLGGIIEEIDLDHDSPLAYFRSRIVRSETPRLTAEQFPHVDCDIAILRQYLCDAGAQHTKGVNVLLYGEPGSGKTEFVRMLSADVGLELFEVAVTTRDGSPLDGSERMRAFRLGQTLLGRTRRHAVLFDEVEDVFREEDKGPRSNSNRSGRKGLVNRLLEDNPVPAFWITNNLWVIDRAFLRRFDYVLALNAPPRSVRGRVLDDYLADLPVSDAWKQRMAEHDGLVPAIVERAARVVRSAKDSHPPQQTERALERVIGNTLEVMGLPREPRNWVPIATSYRLDVLNTDCDMAEVQAGLCEHREGRVCLYGPPGTGKTAFGRYIAETLDRPLLIRRASDIISPWLGMTEQNMARMFRQAQEEEAVLLLDEADSFLQDRHGAQRSWEITEVNEMLTQMESFNGIFIASTNLMASLDAAALRRFDLKICFDYLRPAQAWLLFQDTSAKLGIQVDPAQAIPLARLGVLTPGDFSNVVRQARLRRIRTGHDLLERLSAECEAKPQGRRSNMGFT